MVKIIAGLMGSSVMSGSTKLATTDQVRNLLQACQRHGVTELDTARVYNAGKSEELLGTIPEVQHDFAVQTKCPGFMPGSLSYDRVLSNCNASLAALKQSRLDIYYFHGPDRRTPLEDSCRAINELYNQGKFTRFGISNFRADEVEEIITTCKRNKWVLPTVYQGGYNPVARAGEKALFPLLRQHRIAFYAFSPLAGGYFSRPAEELTTPPPGSRMDQMAIFSSLYVNDESLKLHKLLTNACNKNGLTMREATLRWAMHHSILGPEDGVILGASTSEQMEANIEACSKGPLAQELVDLYEDIWKQYSATGRADAYSV
ncbi:hypothetical protein B9Z65_8310 [Elsinoe australis]|uniref:NADP-dependent oxidoreductase domain-containing protein n=1 Tax=Elsinoe australis TaxID=40998 RepID=A0A2P7YDF3_9PEZI|nr:hypothetical protein B9Z65_8310 [Elsinoe australis]